MYKYKNPEKQGNEVFENKSRKNNYEKILPMFSVNTEENSWSDCIHLNIFYFVSGYP